MATERREALAHKGTGDESRRNALAILRLPTVKARTGLARSTIYLRVSEGTFPQPISLGPRAIGWIESEIEEWLMRRIKASRNAAT